MKVLIQSFWEKFPENCNTHGQCGENTSHCSTPNQPLLLQAVSHHHRHGFSDASEQAYAAIVYIKASYASEAPSVSLVTAKSKVSENQLQGWNYVEHSFWPSLSTQSAPHSYLKCMHGRWCPIGSKKVQNLSWPEHPILLSSENRLESKATCHVITPPSDWLIAK